MRWIPEFSLCSKSNNASFTQHCCVVNALLVSIVVAAAGCQAPSYANQGAAMGGLAGGGIGALIGEAADEPLVGAVVGSAVGALTGASVGSGLDANLANEQRVQQAVFDEYANNISLQEVVDMARAGLSDDIINRHIDSHGFSGALDAQDLIGLRQQGVSDYVISRLQNASSPVRLAQAQTTVVQAAPRVVVEEYRSVPAPHFPWHPRYRPHPIPCPPRYRPGVQWGVSFGH